MPKRMIVTIGYEAYAMNPGDFAYLVDLAERAPLVRRDSYREPYRPAVAATTFITAAILDDFDHHPLPATAHEPVEPAPPPAPAPDDDIVF